MSTTIKIHVADGRDRDAQINLTFEQAAMVSEFIDHVQYGDIHRRIADFGDGNRRGSPSDLKVTACRDGLGLLGHVFASALREP